MSNLVRWPGRMSPVLILCAASVLPCLSKTVVFWQDGFPTVDSQPISKPVLERALAGSQLSFASIDELASGGLLQNSDLLVLPYGSAFPERAWKSMHEFLLGGGDLLVLGGRPFRVPVRSDHGFAQAPPEDAYAREIGLLHTYEAPSYASFNPDAANREPGGQTSQFAWREGYSFLPNLHLQPEKVFVLESRHLDGLGYMINSEGEKSSAPVVVVNHLGSAAGNSVGSRWVFLDFQPAPGFWETPDGLSLLGSAAGYARAGALLLSVELQFSTAKRGETPSAVLHFDNPHAREPGAKQSGQCTVELASGNSAIARRMIDCTSSFVDQAIDFPNSLAPGFYNVRATYLNSAGKPASIYQNGFWVEDENLLKSGPQLGVDKDFLTRDGHPFFPFGTNYFSTESNGWDFSGPRNAYVWERDFANMEKHNVSFVRTGVWGGQMKITDSPDGGVSERFLRNVEAYLLCANRHHIAVNFTFFAFDPQSTLRVGQNNPVMLLPGSNPYLDPVTIRAEQNYMLSIVNRFKDVPFLSWDLINEPSFSNPKALWHGNTPSNDPAELHAWHEWLLKKYGEPGKLATAWSFTPDQLGSFDSVPLPSAADLSADLENGDAGMVRAFDYNLFAQDSFSRWVQQMVSAIRGTGSQQLIDVGQDEGGVENRVLNQFYARSGISFTTNHTYRQNQALLWDSFAAKAPGVASIVGETGYQPITYPNGNWHFDESSGFSLIEQKWAAGFASGTSGALSWDWDREIYFGIERSDGSAKIWEPLMRDMGDFAKKAGPYATTLVAPDVAVVLPQSLQLSVFNHLSIEAQQKCLRALYGYARTDAYAVGEDQIDLLGHPKLIIVPSPWVLESHAWEVIVGAVKAGATLLISGRFDLDPHFRETSRPSEIGIAYEPRMLDLVENRLAWPQGAGELEYGEQKTNYLQRAELPDGQTFVQKQIGSGTVLFSALPLEVNDNLKAVGEVYKYALKVAKVSAAYSTDMGDPALSICPTRFPHATLYVLSSQSDAGEVSFEDARSKKQFNVRLLPGRAALLLIGEDGKVLASYNALGH